MTMDLRSPDPRIKQLLQVLKKLSRAVVGGLDTGAKLCMSWSRLAHHQTYLNYLASFHELFLQDRLFYDKTAMPDQPYGAQGPSMNISREAVEHA
jgi:hypothetical protein